MKVLSPCSVSVMVTSKYKCLWGVRGRDKERDSSLREGKFLTHIYLDYFKVEFLFCI